MESEQGKLFVGGISSDTTEDSLYEHFSKYGEVIELVIVKDRITGNARGFGFVQFAEKSDFDEALQSKHVINGRKVEVKKAIPRGEKQHNQYHPHQQNNGEGDDSDKDFKTSKIFVGGLSADVTEEEFKGYFEKFGKITDVVVMYDSETRRPRGFGFITFDSEEAVEEAMKTKYHELNKKFVEVKRAVPKEENNGRNSNNRYYNNNTHNSYNMGKNGGRGDFNGYNYGSYPYYGYGYFTGYGPTIPGYGNIGSYPYGAMGYVGGFGYPYGGQGGFGYTAAVRGPWNVPYRGGMIPYRNPVSDATYPNNMGDNADASYNGSMEQNQTNGGGGGGGGDSQKSVDLTPMQANDGNLDNGSSDIVEVGIVKEGGDALQADSVQVLVDDGNLNNGASGSVGDYDDTLNSKNLGQIEVFSC